MKILIGYDGSHGSEAIFADLALAGLPKTGEGMVVAVAEVWPQPKSYWMADLPVSEDTKVREVAKRGADQLKLALPGWQIGHEPRAASSAALAIVKQADEWHPDLIVVGSRGRSAFVRGLLGSVAQQVISAARCSVRVARESQKRTGNGVRLLVGLDGSPDSEAAVRAVAARSWPQRSEVRLVTAAGLFTDVPPGLDGMHGIFVPVAPQQRDEMLAQAKAWQDAAAKTLRAAGLTVSAVTKDDDPKRALIAEAESLGADCIVVGSTGMTRFERFLLGSVSTAVATRAHCSVEIVRSGK
ncbi:MAG: universal stress protein [Planctomycetota bacterium]